jgi:NADH-quinone oxidoreductase subunit L
MGQLAADRDDGDRRLALAYVFYIRRARICRSNSPPAAGLLYQFLLNKWYFDELYDFLFVRRPMAGSARFLWKVGDGYIIDGFGPDGVSRACST